MVNVVDCLNRHTTVTSSSIKSDVLPDLLSSLLSCASDELSFSEVLSARSRIQPRSINEPKGKVKAYQEESKRTTDEEECSCIEAECHFFVLSFRIRISEIVD